MTKPLTRADLNALGPEERARALAGLSPEERSAVGFAEEAELELNPELEDRFTEINRKFFGYDK